VSDLGLEVKIPSNLDNARSARHRVRLLPTEEALRKPDPAQAVRITESKVRQGVPIKYSALNFLVLLRCNRGRYRPISSLRAASAPAACAATSPSPLS
jgi:hypothetical protein